MLHRFIDTSAQPFNLFGVLEHGLPNAIRAHEA
jgi:hypothetical protein